MRVPLLVGIVALVVLIGAGGATRGAGADQEITGLPDSIAGLGDSITRAANSDASGDRPENSWVTGTNVSVDTVYLRLLAIHPPISGNRFNEAVSGARMTDLNSQAEDAVAAGAELVTVLMGANDVCTSSEASMTSVATFQTQFETAMATLASGLPDARIAVLSIPDIHNLWTILKDDASARFIWDSLSICQSLLADPLSNDAADVQRRANVRQRNMDFNDVLNSVCAGYIHCQFDGYLAFNTAYTPAHVSTIDYFHPSIAGQALIAQAFWYAIGAPPITGYPDSIAGLGDVITTGLTTFPPNELSWVTGSNDLFIVDSIYWRLLALHPPIAGNRFNEAVGDARMTDLNSQAQDAVADGAELVTVLMGAFDVCTSTEASMTPVATFQAQFETAMATLASGLPDSRIAVLSIPDIHNLWVILKDDASARAAWASLSICQSLLANPLSNDAADVQRRANVRQRNMDFNDVLNSVCAGYIHCTFDNYRFFNTAYTPAHIVPSGDYYQPSQTGQILIGQVFWSAFARTIGAPITVDSIADTSDFSTADRVCDTDDSVGDGPCTLRAAIEQANFDLGTDTIEFSIAGAGPHTISPGSALPTITDPVIIDGTSEPDFVSTPIVELDGTSAGSFPVVDGLNITAGSSTVKGLVINRFSGDGIELSGSGATGNTIEGNFIGTDTTGTVDEGNVRGVRLSGAPGNTIGGTTAAQRNVISGNAFGVLILGSGATGNVVEGNYIGTDVTGSADLGGPPAFIGVDISGAPANTVGGTTVGARNVISGNFLGVRIGGSGATGNDVQGNYIGTQADGVSALGNGSHGVQIGASDNSIGGTAAGAGNTIAFNGGDGVYVESGTGNLIDPNSIHSNGELGIDLGTDGVTVNDPDDPDTGANNLQNFPDLTVAASGGSTTTIQGTLDSLASTTFTLEFFSNTSCDGSGNGEGETFLASTTETTDGSGDVTFTVAVGVAVPVGGFIAATATDPGNNTSEFSACEVVLIDSDDDGVPDTTDVCPNDANDDADGDGICVGSGFNSPKTGDNDNCPALPNANQSNVDLDGVGDACDTEGPSPNTAGLGGADDCDDGVDNDGDSLTDGADPTCDGDGDGTADITDNCPTLPNANQSNVDLDGLGDACDTEGPSPNTAGLGGADDCDDAMDNDGDSLTDGADPTCDGDGDGFADIIDNCPSTATPWFVNLGDTDCDGFADTISYTTRASEAFVGTDPNDSCADTTTPNDERGPAFGEPLSPWVTDTNDNGITTLSDVLGVSPFFNSPIPNPNYTVRYDWNGDGKVTLSDMLAVSPFFNKVCVP